MYNCFAEAILQNADLEPNSVAIVDNNGCRKTTWNQLKILALKAATLANKEGLSGIIPVVMPRSLEYVATVLGFNLAGVGVAPLSTDYPIDRINTIKSMLNASIIADERFFEKCLNIDIEDFEYKSKSDGKDFVLFTSGSTGKPKGIIYSNPNVLDAVNSSITYFHNCSDLVAASFASFGFCVSFHDLWAPLKAGSKVHILSEECRKNVSSLEEYYIDNSIEITFLPPSLIGLLQKDLPHMKLIFIGGEKVSFLAPRSYKIFVIYGMTEAIGAIAGFELDKSYENTPVGKAFPHKSVFLLNKKGEKCEEGEICVSGLLATGYYEQQELTDKQFTKNPFSHSEEFDNLLHTGDFGKLLPDGNLLFISRKDWMIKVNGQRVDLLEVETQIKSILGVDEAVVKAFVNNQGNNYISAWYTGKMVSEEQIIENLKLKLLDYMIPKFVIQLESFQKSVNGKIDRNVLQAPEVVTNKTTYVAPTNKLEKILCKKFASILRLEKVGINDDFFALGGDSLQAITLCFGLEVYSIRTKDVFEGRTPKQIVNLALSKKKAAPKHTLKVDILEFYPLTSGQYNVYYDSTRAPEKLTYNLPFASQLSSDTDKEQLKEALSKVINHYSAFSVAIKQSGEDVKMVKCATSFNFKQINATEVELDSIKRDFVKPFNLEKGELSRFLLVTTEKTLWLLCDFHHIIFDGSSIEYFFKALADAYINKDLEPEKTPFYEAGLLESANTTEDSVNNAVDYFTKILEENDYEDLIPADLPSKTSSLPEVCKTQTRNLSFIDSNSVEAYVRKIAVSESSFFMGAFAWAAAKVCGTLGFCFLTAESGRTIESIAKSIGMFVRSIPMSISVDEQLSSQNYLKKLSNKVYEAFSQEKCPFHKLVEKSHIKCQTQFIYQGELFKEFDLNGANLTLSKIDNIDYNARLKVEIFKSNGIYTCNVLYRSDLYSEDLINTFIGLIEKAAYGFIKNLLLKEIPLVNQEELALLESFHGSKCDFENKNLLELVKNSINTYSDNIAIISNNIKISYKELDHITDKIAAYLIAKGIGREDVVAILAERNEMMAICPLGVMKAGAIFQPLDNTYPSERLTYMVDDSQAKILIAPKSLRGLVSTDIETLYIEDIEKLPDSEFSLPEAKPEDGFVLIYTSGSTGNPKGILLEQGNFASFHQVYNPIFDLNQDSTVGAYSSFGFDASVGDIFGTFVAGATLCVIPEEVRLDLEKLGDYLCENNVTHMFMTTQMARLFISLRIKSKLKYLSFGGEKLTPIDPPTDYKAIHGYGPSETTVFVTSFLFDKYYENTPLGRVFPGIKAYVVDRYMRRLPVGLPGELLLSGSQVARGYLNRITKSMEVFINNPFCQETEYKRTYRTGDIVSFMSDGKLLFIGRSDHQVKIRGFRIELTGIEEVINKFPGIKYSAVIAYEEPNIEKYLVAYVVSDTAVNLIELKDYIAKRKPAYMVPEVIMQIESLPLTQNLKLNKKALPKPVRNSSAFIKPSNDLQIQIFDSLSEALGHKDFGVNTNFFDAGLTSISGTRFLSIISNKLKKHLSFKDLVNNNSIELLEKLFETHNKSHSNGLRNKYPLTKTQESILYSCLNRPKSNFYNIPYVIKLDKSIDSHKLKNALVAAVNAHPYILTEVFLDKDGPLCNRKFNNIFKSSDIEDVEVESINPVNNGLLKPYNLIGSRLFRFYLMHCNDELALYIDFHHLIFDGTSLKIFLDDVSDAYAGLKLQEERYSCYEYALEERALLNTPAYEEAKKYYEELLSDCQSNSLPFGDCPLGIGFDVANFKLEGSLVTDLEEFCQVNGLTEVSYFTSAFGYLLAKYQRESTSLFTTIYNGRLDNRLERCVSLFVKTYPIICKLGDISIVDYIRRCSEQLKNSRHHDLYSFFDINRDLGINADVIFVYQGNGFLPTTFCGQPCSIVSPDIDSGKAKLVVVVTSTNEGFELNVEYDSSLYSRDYIKAFVHNYFVVLVAFIHDKNLTNINLLDEESLKVLKSFQGKELGTETNSVVDLLNKVFYETKDKVALISGSNKITYKELNHISTRLAAHLIDRGIKKEQVVAILCDRDENMVICPLGVTKAGAIIQPLDNTYPSERLTFMVKDSGAKLLITPKKYRDLINTDIDVIYTEDIADLPESNSQLPLVKPEDAFLIIYTSGSTGKPKGCVLEHRNFARFLPLYNEIVSRKEDSVIGCYASFGFDAGVSDIFSSIIASATLYIIPLEKRLNILELSQVLIENKVDNMFMTTQMGKALINSGIEHGLKHLILAGEKLSAIELPNNCKIYNGYGPTETTCGLTLLSVDRKYDNIPLGHIIDGMKAYIIDENFKPLPVGIPGELLVAGPQVSRGYLNRAEENQRAFITNPFSHKPDYSRLYRTGDIVCILPDGNLQFLGRNDSQVKIRGYRIELSAIEEVIRRYRSVKDVVVTTFDDPSVGKYLAAYVVSEELIDREALRDFIKAEKPAYMVPDCITQIESIPLTINHKVNYRALPAPIRTLSKYVEPVNKIEREFCEIMGNLLGLKNYSAVDSFFDLGGTSILASSVLIEALAKGYKISYANLFKYPSPRKISDFLNFKKMKRVKNISSFITDYDYSFIHGSLEKSYNSTQNQLKKLDKSILSGNIGDILITGASGYLGIHILREFLKNYKGKAICLLRGSEKLPAIQRLKDLFHYYFSDNFDSEFESGRVICVDCDINDENLPEVFKDYYFDSLIHCAACVKHFVADEVLYKVNTLGTKNLLSLCERRNKTFVHISTSSVAGFLNEKVANLTFTEKTLYLGQDLNNDYIKTKFLAERCVLEAATRDSKVKIIRVGNLMSRYSDGHFQINYDTNGFMRDLRGIATLGCAPYERNDKEIDVSPIDSVATAILKIADSNYKALIYHAYHPIPVKAKAWLDALRQCQFPVREVNEDEYKKKINEAILKYKDNPYMANILGGLLAYKDQESGEIPEFMKINNDFTMKILEQLFFVWPILDSNYFETSLKHLIKLGFFKM